MTFNNYPLNYQLVLDEQIQLLRDVNAKLETSDTPKSVPQIRENASVIAQLVREQRIAAYHAAKENEPQRHGAHPEDTTDVESFGKELIATINKSSL